MERGARDDRARMPTNRPVSDDEGLPPLLIRSPDWATFAACRSRSAPDLSEAAAGPVCVTLPSRWLDLARIATMSRRP